MKKTLIKNATVVLPDEAIKTSVIIEGHTIADIDPAPQMVVDEAVDANGLWLIPGIIDDQVHFREPGLTHKEDLRHATRACAKGGVTSFLEMPNTIPNTISQVRLNEKLELAERTCLVNYGFYIGATPDNLDELKNASRTPGIKIFIGSSTGDLLVDDQAILERIFAETTLPICAHCEDESTVRNNAAKYSGVDDVKCHSKIRDHAAALIATRRALDLATRHQHRFHVLHVSTAAEVGEIGEAGELISGEVCPHHLFFQVEDYDRLGSLIKMNPSVKNREDNLALWEALLNGDLQVVATDHAPHTLDEKRQPFPKCPSGLPAVENALALMLNQVNTGRCSVEQVVKWMSTNPAKIWNIRNKGEIAVGMDADLVLVDLALQQEVRNEEQLTKSRWSPWHGEKLTGWAVRTWVMGQLAFEWREEKQWITEQSLGHEILFQH